LAFTVFVIKAEIKRVGIFIAKRKDVANFGSFNLLKFGLIKAESF
jgi:hypothetical protein